MATGVRKDPYRGYNFRLEIGGVVLAAFRECSGLGEESTAEQRPHNISLKWGMTDDHSLLEWVNSIDGKTERKNGSIVMNDAMGAGEKVRWNFTNGWPTKWTGSSFNASADCVEIESLEIAHEGLTPA